MQSLKLCSFANGLISYPEHELYLSIIRITSTIYHLINSLLHHLSSVTFPIFVRMILTDTHIHLYAGEFDTDRDLLISDAIARGVQRFFLPNIDSTSTDVLLPLQKKYPGKCFAMMGLHPCSVKANWEEEMEKVESLLLRSETKFVAVGEIGMDLYWDKTFVREQEEVFRRQLRFARQLDLPVVIHSRESFEEIYCILLEENQNSKSDAGIPETGNLRPETLDGWASPPSRVKPRDRKPLRGIFHCFTGTLDQARRAIALGFYLGIGGVVTFKNSGLDKVVAELALEHVVLETDAPYLAPVPFRGKRNLPGYILKVAEKIAEIKNISLQQVAEVTTQNSKTIFGV